MISDALPVQQTRCGALTRPVFLVLLAALPFIAVFVPRVLATALPILGVIATMAAYFYEQKRPAISLKPFLFIVPVLVLAALSSFWAIDPEFALKRSGKMAAVLLPGGLLIGVLLRREAAFFKGFEHFLLISFLTAIVLNISELAFQGPIFKFTHGPDAVFKYSSLNRSIVSAALCAVAALITPLVIFRSRKVKTAKYIVLSGLIFVLCVLTYSQSTHLALAVMGLSFAVFPVRWKAAWIALGLAIMGLTLSAPFFTQMAYETLPPYMEGVNWFQHSYAAARLEIWDFISRYALQSPIYGHGIEATRMVEEFDSQHLYHDEKTILHPHNFALQLWMEFGAIGALAGCAFLGFLLNELRKLPALPARIGLASLLGCMAVASTGYGLWQGWWLAIFLMVASYSIIMGKMVISAKADR